MSFQDKPSLPVIRRLPKYFRYLELLENSGAAKVSSSQLADMMGTTASQVRQDLNCFGGFGQQGIGYNVHLLHEELRKRIYPKRPFPTILIGAGNLGHAIGHYFTESSNKGFELISAFDVRKDLIGNEICGVEIRDMSELADYCGLHKPKAAVICIPRSAAKDVSSELIDLGIRCFWNFSHYDFSIEYPDITIENVHLSDSLATLSYEMNNK